MEWRGSRSKNYSFSNSYRNTKPRQRRGFQLVEKVRFLFCASCDSTHKIEFAQQIHKNRGRGPDHPLLPLCGNSPCVPRFFFSIRSKAWFRSRGCSKNDSFSTASTPRQRRGFVIPESQKERVESASLSTLTLLKLLALQQTGRLGRIDQIGHAAQADAQRRQVVHHRRGCGSQHAGNAQTDQ